MKIINVKRLLLATQFLFFSLTFAHAQSNFNGSYTLNKGKVDFGNAPEWVLPTKFKVIKNGSKLNITRTTLNASGTENIRTLDIVPGTSADYTSSSGSKNSTVVVWDNDKKGFTLTMRSVKPDGTNDQSYKEVWALTDEGKTLVIDRTVQQANGLSYSIKAIYDKN